jgi:hypothetical protein
MHTLARLMLLSGLSRDTSCRNCCCAQDTTCVVEVVELVSCSVCVWGGGGTGADAEQGDEGEGNVESRM